MLFQNLCKVRDERIWKKHKNQIREFNPEKTVNKSVDKVDTRQEVVKRSIIPRLMESSFGCPGPVNNLQNDHEGCARAH